MFELNGERIALVTDTACDLSDEQLQKYDIRLVCLRMNTSKGELRDRLEINVDTVYEMLKTEIPHTSLPLPEDVEALFQSLIDEGATRIVHISISSGLSGTYNMIRMIADDFSDRIKIDVFDSRTLSCGLGLLVLDAAEQLQAGRSVEDVIARLTRLRENQLGTFVIRTLEFLRKGGRIGLVEGVVGSLLQLKPVICVNDDGVYDTLAKGRGMNNAINTMFDAFIRRYTGHRVRVAVVHGNDYEGAQKLLSRLKEKLDIVSSFIAPISPVLAIHTGSGLQGIIVQYAD